MSGQTILFVDDDPSFASEVAEYLGRYAFQVTMVSTLGAAMEALTRGVPDLLILDQFLAETDALEALPDIRRTYSGPLMVLTGNADAADRIKGLEIGADDFVSKTMPPREILARVRALARRVRATPVESGPPPGLDPLRRVAIAPNGDVIDLTGAEYEMLKLLSENVGTPISRETLSANVLRRPFNSADRGVDNLVTQLRHKLEPFRRGAQIIMSVRNVGYCFTGFGHEGSRPG